MTPLGLTLALLVVVSSIGWIAYTVRRARREAPFLFGDPSNARDFEAEPDALWVLDLRGRRHRLGWGEIAEVRIRTTDRGPFTDDVFWEVATTDGGTVHVVPGSAPGIDGLLAIAGTVLIGFDHMAVVRALGSTANAVFRIWPPEDASGA